MGNGKMCDGILLASLVFREVVLKCDVLSLFCSSKKKKKIQVTVIKSNDCPPSDFIPRTAFCPTRTRGN